MMRATRASSALAACAFLAGLVTSPVQGDLVQIRVSDSLGRSLVVSDGGLGDQNVSGNAINIDESLLLLTFPELDLGTAIGASSNQASLTDVFDRIEQTATLIRDDIAGILDISYTIVATQADFLLPPGTSGFVNSTASVTFNNAPPANSLTVDGGVDTGNTPFLISTNAGTIGPLSSIGVFPNASAGNAGPAAFADSDVFSITVQSVVSTTENAEAQITAAVRVDPAAIPEPGSLVLASLLGGVGLIGTGLRRVRGKASRRSP